MSKVVITKYVNGLEIKSEVDYMPALNKPNKGNVIKKLSKKKQKKLDYQSKAKDKKGFYSSKEWLELRYRVLRNYEGCCMCCGRSRKRDKVVIHVDHIKPRSKFPELELQYDNLQLLCAACNKGKSNKDTTDWRP